jgi:hypothetical protein
VSAIKLIPKVRGAHIHVAIFSGPDPDHLGKSGDLVFDPPEWDFFKGMFMESDAFGMMNREDVTLLIDLRTVLNNNSVDATAIRRVYTKLGMLPPSPVKKGGTDGTVL